MLLTGRFHGRLKRGRRIDAEFDDLSAAEAIVWGRGQCAVVLIRTGDSDYHSAGERNPDPAECPRWPRRVCGLNRPGSLGGRRSTSTTAPRTTRTVTSTTSRSTSGQPEWR